MAKPPPILDLDEDRVGKEGLKALLRPLAEHAQLVHTALSGGLSFAENLQAEWVEFFITIPAPVWHLVGETGEPAFQHGWANLGGGALPVQFRIDAWGMVTVRGVATGGAADVMFQLPSGYWPDSNEIWVADESAGVQASYSVNSGGEVTVISTTSSAWFALGTALFQADGACAPPEAWVENGFPLSIPTKKLPRVRAVLVGKVTPKTVAGEAIGPVAVDWEEGGGGVRIKALHGLSPGRAYSVSLLLLGG